MPIETQEPDYDLSFLLQPMAPSEEGLRQIRRQAGRRRLARRTSAIAAALLFVAGLAGLVAIGGDKDDKETRLAAPSALQVVQRLPETMANAGGATIKVTAADDNGPVEAFDATYDFGRKTGLLKLEAAQRPEESEIRIVDGIMYLPSAGETKGSVIWYSVDPKEIGRAKPEAKQSVASVALANPGTAMELLGGATEVQDLGADPVDGVSAHRYRALLDVTKLDGLARLAGDLLIDTNPGRHVDVWIDSSGRALRLALETGGDNPLKLDYRISGFGQNIQVERPSGQIVSAIEAGYGQTQTVRGSGSATIGNEGQSNCTTSYQSNGTTSVVSQPC